MVGRTSVVGGGLSGLAAAFYFLQRFGNRFGKLVNLYESSNRVGGWIRTERHKDRGFILEAGPRTIRPKGISGANTLQLIEKLQLPIESIPSHHQAARNRMLYAKGQLCMLPNSFAGLFRTIPPFTKPLISALMHDLRAKRKHIKIGDESIYDFTERRFGSEIAQYAISPMICGICAGDAKEISVRFLMDELFDKEQQFGGVAKGLFLSKLQSKKEKVKGDTESNVLYEKACSERWSMYRVQGGLEQLPLTLSNYLRTNDVNIHLSTELRSITFLGDRAGVRLDIKGQLVDTDHVVAALPAHRLAGCVKEQHPSLAGQLLAIPYVDVAVVNLQYNARDILPHQGFGFLVPPLERLPILGVIFDSCCFDMADNTVLTVMMGGSWFEQNFGKTPSQKELLDTALQHVERILGIEQEPRMSRVHILSKCIPQYTVGHKRRVADIRRYIERYKLPLSVCGAAYDGVGINDVVLSARHQIEALPSSVSI